MLGWEVSNVEAKELAEEGGVLVPEMFFARFKIESSAFFGAVLEIARTAAKRLDGADGRAELKPKRRRVAIRLMMCGSMSPIGAGGSRSRGPWCCVQRPERNLAKPASAASVGAWILPVGKIKSGGRESTPAESQNRRQRLSRQHHDEAFNSVFIFSAFCSLLRGGIQDARC